MLHANRDQLLNEKCKLHPEAKYDLVCMEPTCIERMTCFICRVCRSKHPPAHFPNVVPYHSVFSFEILPEIEQCMNKQESKLAKLVQSEPTLIASLEGTFTDIFQHFTQKMDHVKYSIYLKLIENVFPSNHPERISWKRCLEEMTKCADNLYQSGLSNQSIVKEWLNRYAQVNQYITEINEKVKDMPASDIEIAVNEKVTKDFKTQLDTLGDTFIENFISLSKGTSKTPRAMSTSVKNLKDSGFSIDDADANARNRTVSMWFHPARTETPQNVDVKCLLDLEDAVKKQCKDITMMLERTRREDEIKMFNFLAKYNGLASLHIKFDKGRIIDDTFSQILPTMKALTSLQNLKLDLSKSSKGKVTDEGIRLLSEGFGQLLKLQSLILDFSETQVQDLGIIHIAVEAEKLKELRTLSLDFHGRFDNLFDLMNSTSLEGPKALSKTIKELKHLVNLSLIFSGFSCKINDELLKEMTNEIKKSQNWESLTLHFHENILSDDGIRNLAGTVKGMKLLSTLNLGFFWGNGKISDEGVKDLALTFQTLASLSSLTLAFNWVSNPLTDKSLEYIVSSLKQNAMLESLTIEMSGGRDKITNDTLKVMFSHITHLKNLKKISLIFSRYKINPNKDLVTIVANALAPLADLQSLSLEFTGVKTNPKDFDNQLKDKLKKCAVIIKSQA